MSTNPLILTFSLMLIMAYGGRSQSLPVLETGGTATMPLAWIDRDTGHKIVHLIPGGGSNQSFYFHNDPFVDAADGNGKEMVYYGRTPRGMQLFAVSLASRKSRQLTDRKGVSGEIVAKKSREVYYQCGDSVFATGTVSGRTRLIYVFQDSLRGRITTINASETLLAGAITSREEDSLFRKYPEKKDYFNVIYEARLPRTLFAIDIAAGRLKKIYSERAWLNHIQFSPTDPDVLMFCHEGPWHKVDRIWTIRLSGGQPQLMHRRTLEGEIAGHEFFSPDGRQIWFDLQMPRSVTFYLQGVDIATGQVTRYAMQRNEWSIHFTNSPDQKIFAGDGGDPGQVAKAADGMWIYLFRPEGEHFAAEKLVNIKHHNYKLEPNVHFSPDGKMIIFRANFEGHPDIYAVEIASSGKDTAIQPTR